MATLMLETQLLQELIAVRTELAAHTRSIAALHRLMIVLIQMAEDQRPTTRQNEVARDGR